MNERKTIVTMPFGSQLYGTATPESDKDFKSVFMPSRREILLGRIPKTIRLGTKTNETRKNTPQDIDHEAYSLHYFIELACKGETVALDMLHAPLAVCTELNGQTWIDLRFYRDRFYTKNLKALVGYARRQAAKYGIKGSRLSDAKQVLDILENADEFTKIGDLNLPHLEHAHWFGTEMYEVCGKRLQTTARVKDYIDTVRKYVNAYGHRAKLAEINEGIDWKAVSHAFRAAYQIQHILTDGWFEYPLPETEKILQVKLGKLPFVQASQDLEDLIDGIEILSQQSTLPEKVDRSFWDTWLMYAITENHDDGLWWGA